MTSIAYKPQITRHKHRRLNYLIEALNRPVFEVPSWSKIDDAIVHTVITQMLSRDAAQSILQKLYEAHGTSANILAWAVKSSQRRGPIYGVSQRKRKALHRWNTHVSEHGRIWKSWSGLPVDDLRVQICELWGFGEWSADMLAIFYLGRTDVWPHTDTGIKNIATLVFGTSEYDSIRKYVSGNETFIALCFWKAINSGLAPQLRKKWIT